MSIQFKSKNEKVAKKQTTIRKQEQKQNSKKFT